MEARYSLPPQVRSFYEQKGQSMPLKDVQGLGDLTKLGNIRLGWTEPTQSGYEMPVASDYFVLVDAPFLAEVLGEKPASLDIHFPYPSFDDNISADYRVWAGGRTKGSGISVCQGDGELVHSALPFKVTVDKKDRTHVNRAPGDRLVSYGKAAIDFQWGEHVFQEGERVPCPGSSKGTYPHCAACSPSILVKVMIRKPIEAARWGYWQIATRSLRNYKHFMGVWASITNGGKIPIPMNDVPFVLRIMPGNTLFQNQKDQMWSSREAFFLKLEVDQKVAELVEGARNRRFVAMLEGRVDPMLIPQLSAELERDFEEELPFDEPPLYEDAMPYDDELIEGDAFLERAGDYSGASPNGDAIEDVREELEQVDVPKGLTHGNLVKKAVELLPGYKNAGQVKGAMLAITQDSQWEKSTEWSPRDKWAELQDHARAPA
jgi:hypothetical protein